MIEIASLTYDNVIGLQYNLNFNSETIYWEALRLKFGGTLSVLILTLELSEKTFSEGQGFLYPSLV